MINLGELNTLLVIGAIVAMVIRLLAIAAYGREGPIWLTTYVPTVAVIALLVRRLVLRVSDVLEPDDLTLTLCLAAVLITQLTAGVVAWLPKREPAQP